MSAIAGILGRVDDPANRSALEKMSAAMLHRGPDASGQWRSPADSQGNGILLAHRRLTVLDTSDQPLVDGARVLLSDGSIFSHPQGQDVMRELRVGGYAALAKLRGAFALALWDDSTRQLLLARDALGHKPLYFIRGSTAQTWFLAFASELRALLASGLLGDRKRLDPIGAASFIWNGFVMSPRTIVQGVQSLMPGECRVFETTGEERSQEFFWSMPSPGPISSDESAIRDELRQVVRENIQHDTSAPLAVLLSGGIDSSSIANLAQLQRERADGPIQTYCMAMEEAPLNEADAARRIAHGLGTEHHEVMLSEQKFVETLDDAIASLDQPTFDGLNQYHICRALHEEGMKIAVGGIGGDGIFGGDKTLRQLPRLKRIAACTSWLPDSAVVATAKIVAAAQTKDSTSPMGSQQKWAKLPDVARAKGDLLALYQITYALFLPDFQRELLTEMHPSVRYGLPRETHDWLSREIEGHAAIEVAALLEARCFVGERLLRDADSVSSALSLELRSPLADPRIIEVLSRLPVERKFLPVGRKPLLRKYGLEGVEPELYERSKSGFVLPFDRWIRRGLGKVMDQVMRDQAACAAAGLQGDAVSRLWQTFQQGVPGHYWTRAWAVYVLLRWCHRHQVHA